MDPLLEHFGYAAIFALLVGAGVGVPVPEEVTQMTAGVLAHQDVFQVWKALLVAWAGVVAGDSLVYLVGRRHGERVLSSRLVRRVLTNDRRERLHGHFERHAFLTIVVARHLASVRSAAFALAGVQGVPYRTVLLADGLSAAVSVPVAVGLGFLFSRHVLQVERDMRVVEGAIVVLIALAAVVHWLRSRGAPGARGAIDGEVAEEASPRPIPDLPRSARRVLAAFLATFLVARTLVYLIMSRRLPDVTFHAAGTHVHHLNYGIFLLALVGAALLFLPQGDRLRRAATIAYGVGLALTFDEFGMWLHLGGGYWQRSSFDAVVTIAATLGLVASAPALRAFRLTHWAVTVGLALGLALFGFLLVDSVRAAENRWWPSLQALDLAPPP